MPSAVVPKSLLKPIPASQARSRAQEILDRNREHVERAIINGGRRELVRILVRAQKDLEERLRAMGRDGNARWTAHDVEATLVQVRVALAQIAPRFRHLLEENARRAAEVGAKNTAELLTYFERRAGGLVEGGVLRPLSIRQAVALRHTLLMEYATSVDRYGRHMIGVIRRELQAGLVRGATFEEMTTLLVGKRGPRGIVSMAAKEMNDGKVVRTREETIREGLFVRWRGWAERIIRTEGMRAYATGAQEEMVAQQHAHFPDLKRKLIETFDRRTGWDSYKAHGEVRGMNEPFVDGAGRVYLLPPGRPNDRACVVPYRDAWAE